MKTVQEVLRKADIKSLEGSFFFENSPDIWRLGKDDNRTIAEVRKSMSYNFRRFVENLKNTEIALPEDGRTMILYAHKQAGEPSWHPETAVDLVSADELLEKEDLSDIVHNAFEFTPRAEALGFLIADNKYTQDNLSEVLTYFLSELSFLDTKNLKWKKKGKRFLHQLKKPRGIRRGLLNGIPRK